MYCKPERVIIFSNMKQYLDQYISSTLLGKTLVHMHQLQVIYTFSNGE